MAGSPLNTTDMTCDGVDDNCNGQIDEGYVPITTSCGIGGCSAVGSTSCINGSVEDSCVAAQPVAEICEDGTDNNCNGLVDEGCSSPPVVSLNSINDAHQNTFNDPALAERVDDGEFVPGSLTEADSDWGYDWTGTYSPGLQAMGVDADGQPTSFLHPTYAAEINSDPYLAYAVQLEEDRLNRQVLAMHAQEAEGDLLATINSVLSAGDIRSRDDLLMQQADAQAGRVLRDSSGAWVRTQQYVLRPDDQTVQMLSVSLRGTGEHAGLSTIEWVTSFRDIIPVNQSLRALPWSSYLNTIAGEGNNYIQFNSGLELDAMSVRFSNPGNDYLEESRTFGNMESFATGSAVFYWQTIERERLASSLWSTDYENFTASEWFVLSASTTGDNPGGFRYIRADETDLATVSFHVLGDADTDNNQGEISGYSNVVFQDIWDALRVNEVGAPSIGNNNLEIVIEGGVFDSNPIDTVYIPLSRMLWK